MEIFFANKSGHPTKLLFNSNQTQQQPVPQKQYTPKQMAASRKSVLMQDKEQTQKDRIKVQVVGLSFYKLKLNPILYAFNTDDLVSMQRVESIDFLDDIQRKNRQKRQNYQDIQTISNMNETKTVVKRPPPANNPVKQIMNLIGCDEKRASAYLRKYNTIQKVYQGYQNQRSTVEQFMKRCKISPQEASFYLQQCDFNINQAMRLRNENR